MSRGNLAEDPQAGLPSSSRYSRMNAENRLLYATDLGRKSKRTKRSKGTGAANNEVEMKKSVGRSLPNSHMSRLEVGSDGRLFGVHITDKKEMSETAGQTSAQMQRQPDSAAKNENGAAGNISAGPASMQASSPQKTPGKAPDVRETMQTAVEAGPAAGPAARRSRKPERSYLSETENPLLSKAILDRIRENKRARKQQGITAAGRAYEASAETSKAGQTHGTPAETSKAGQTHEASAEASKARTRSEEAKKPAGAEISGNSAFAEDRQIRSEAGAGLNPGLNNAAAAAVVVPAAGSMAGSQAFEKEKLKEILADFASRHRKAILISLAGACTAGYIFAGVHFSDHFYPGTQFFGIKADNMTVEEVKAAAAAKVNTYTLSITERDAAQSTAHHGAASGNSSQLINMVYDWGCAAETAMIDCIGEIPADEPDAREQSGQRAAVSTSVRDSISAEEIRLQYDDKGEIEQAMHDQRPYFWPVMMIIQNFKGQPYELNTFYDESAAAAVVDSLSCFAEENIIRPVDAAIAFKTNKAYVSPEVMGTSLDTEAVKAAVYASLDKGTTALDLEKEGFYENPSVYSDDRDLNREVRRLNRVLGACVTLDFGDRSQILNAEKTVEFLSEGEKGKYYIDEEKVRSYVSSLAETFDTIGKKRDFYTSLGTEVSLEGGNYGWELDQEATFEEIFIALQNKKQGRLDPVYTQTAMSRLANDIGNTYIEINISNQRMWMYKEGELIVDTPVVTGDPYKKNDTPSGGVWRVFDIQRNATLRGTGYVTPVDFWIGFNGGVGIHDLQSRYYFGGQIYMGAGSHGCVNTPLSAVKLIFNAVDYGVPVIVYQDDSQTAADARTGARDVYSINAQVEEEFGTVEDDGLGSVVQWTASQKAQNAAWAAGNTVSAT